MDDNLMSTIPRRLLPYKYRGFCRRSVILIILTLLVMLSAGWCCLYIFDRGGITRRLSAHKLVIGAIRHEAKTFNHQKGRYPYSLEELLASKKSKPSLLDLTVIRHQSNQLEYRTLNDKGGCYYDPNTGDVRYNSTRPVKEYIKWYKGPFKNEIPSTW